MKPNRNSILNSTCRNSMLPFALSIILSTPALSTLAAETPLTSTNSVAVAPQPSAQKCMADLRAFDSQMRSEGNWWHGGGKGYGFPMYGYAYGDQGFHDLGTPISGHARARPGYEVRTLIASATILAQRGQQQACDALLTATRAIYKDYAADLRADMVPKADLAMWQRQQMLAAVPVTDGKAAYRSDQLIGAEVVNVQGVDLAGC